VRALWTLSVLTGFVAAVMLAAASWTGIVSWYRRARGCRVDGTVISHETKPQTAGPPSWIPFRARYAIVRYLDAENREHTARLADRPVGAAVTILFSPRKPHRAIAESRWRRSCLILLAVTIACGVLVAVIPHPSSWVG
jgi:hypothetical protein